MPAGFLLELLPEYLDWCYAHERQPCTRDFADWLGVNRVTLYRWCTTEFGVPPNIIIREDRLRRAEELLSHGLTTAQASYRAGYRTRGTMFREFRRHRGTTPRSANQD